MNSKFECLQQSEGEAEAGLAVDAAGATSQSVPLSSPWYERN